MIPSVLVIGALNLDITVFPSRSMVYKDSNEGHIKNSLGGVGFNIAMNLHRLGIKTSFLTVLGTDSWAQLLISKIQSQNLDISNSITIDSASNLYLSVHDSDGSFILGINEMPLMNALTPEILSPLHNYINSFDWLLIESNVSEKTIDYLVHRYSNKLLFGDAVSQEKVKRWSSSIPFLEVFKCNLQEARSLLNLGDIDAETAAQKIHELGVKQVLVTEGAKGVHFIQEGTTHLYEGLKMATFINSSGAGDAFFAAFISAIAHQINLPEAIEMAHKVACITMMSHESTHPELNENWEEIYEKYVNHQ